MENRNSLDRYIVASESTARVRPPTDSRGNDSRFTILGFWLQRFNASLAAAFVLAAVLALSACNHSVGSKVSQGNYDKITTGMSKSQVEQILGKPTRIDDKDFLIMHKTTYRYEDGDRFVMVTFKNDEVDSKESNLATH